LLVELDGVIVAANPAVTKLLLDVDTLVDVEPCTTCNTDPVGNVLFGMDCDPVMVEPATDAISPEATCVKAMFVPYAV
jgi:hypothetical protein